MRTMRTKVLSMVCLTALLTALVSPGLMATTVTTGTAAANTGPRDQIPASRCMRKIQHVRDVAYGKYGLPPGAQIAPIKRCIRHRKISKTAQNCLVAAGFGAATVAVGTLISAGTAGLATPIAARLIVVGGGFDCARTIVQDAL